MIITTRELHDSPSLADRGRQAVPNCLNKFLALLWPHLPSFLLFLFLCLFLFLLAPSTGFGLGEPVNWHCTWFYGRMRAYLYVSPGGVIYVFFQSGLRGIQLDKRKTIGFGLRAFCIYSTGNHGECKHRVTRDSKSPTVTGSGFDSEFTPHPG